MVLAPGSLCTLAVVLLYLHEDIGKLLDRKDVGSLLQRSYSPSLKAKGEAVMWEEEENVHFFISVKKKSCWCCSKCGQADLPP